MYLIIALVLTALLSAFFGLLPGKIKRRSVIKQDIVWAVGLWLATWLTHNCLIKVLRSVIIL